MNCIAFSSDTSGAGVRIMNVIPHEDELVHLKPLFGPILTNDVQQQIAERIGLEDQSSLPSRKRSEERTRFLRCKQHVGSRSLYHQVGEATLLLGGSPPGGRQRFSVVGKSSWWEPPHLCGGRSASALREESRL